MKQLRYRITTDRDGSLEGDDLKLWHVIASGGDTDRLLCSGLAMDAAGDIEVDVKLVVRGGITCPQCLSAIRDIKAIRL